MSAPSSKQSPSSGAKSHDRIESGSDRTTAATRVRQWPEGVAKKGATKAFAKAYREAFDADPLATFCAGEIEGLTIIVAREGDIADKLQRFVVNELDGVIERKALDAESE